METEMPKYRSSTDDYEDKEACRGYIRNVYLCVSLSQNIIITSVLLHLEQQPSALTVSAYVGNRYYSDVNYVIAENLRDSESSFAKLVAHDATGNNLFNELLSFF